jgi:hypothetical protein
MPIIVYSAYVLLTLISVSYAFKHRSIIMIPDVPNLSVGDSHVLINLKFLTSNARRDLVSYF